MPRTTKSKSVPAAPAPRPAPAVVQPESITGSAFFDALIENPTFLKFLARLSMLKGRARRWWAESFNRRSRARAIRAEADAKLQKAIVAARLAAAEKGSSQVKIKTKRRVKKAKRSRPTTEVKPVDTEPDNTKNTLAESIKWVQEKIKEGEFLKGCKLELLLDVSIYILCVIAVVL